MYSWVVLHSAAARKLIGNFVLRTIVLQDIRQYLGMLYLRHNLLFSDPAYHADLSDAVKWKAILRYGSEESLRLLLSLNSFSGAKILSENSEVTTFERWLRIYNMLMGSSNNYIATFHVLLTRRTPSLFENAFNKPDAWRYYKLDECGLLTLDFSNINGEDFEKYCPGECKNFKLSNEMLSYSATLPREKAQRKFKVLAQYGLHPQDEQRYPERVFTRMLENGSFNCVVSDDCDQPLYIKSSSFQKMIKAYICVSQLFAPRVLPIPECVNCVTSIDCLIDKTNMEPRPVLETWKCVLGDFINGNHEFKQYLVVDYLYKNLKFCKGNILPIKATVLVAADVCMCGDDYHSTTHMAKEFCDPNWSYFYNKDHESKDRIVLALDRAFEWKRVENKYVQKII